MEKNIGIERKAVKVFICVEVCAQMLEQRQTCQVGHAGQDDGGAHGSHDEAHCEAEGDGHAEYCLRKNGNHENLAETRQKNQPQSRKSKFAKLGNLDLEPRTQNNNDCTGLARRKDPVITAIC